MVILSVLFVVLIVGIVVWIEAEAHGAWRAGQPEKPRPYRPGDFIE